MCPVADAPIPVNKRIVAFGEVMLRLSAPGRELLMQTPRLDVWVGGAEANVATALARLGHATAMVTAVPDNALGDAAVATLRGHGVDCAGILRRPGRMGLYFVASGAGVRPTRVTYDRAHSSFAEAPAGCWHWPTILEGAGRLHVSGITPALGENASDHILAAATTAVDMGVPVSFDGNYRASLWARRGGDPRSLLTPLVQCADILFGSARDIALLLDRDFAEDAGGAREAAEAAFAAFPRLRLIATTVREIDSVDSNMLRARIDTRDTHIETDAVRVDNIIDRIGAGDAFAAGVLHSLSGDNAIGDAARSGVMLSILKHSLPGDASLFNAVELDDALRGRNELLR